ncbi:uncharacterized protein LOC130635837 isoform X2 [Hydractinia symbiolongicarpus]|uniref:uncharacterized protein LOC130635837 isoform X2 n=1 Tax=Hydractinia symbiolongicarpus TaxID=13093 RepID=UPI00254DFC43|nr:uncharacterized protein LOC130635837 isoform X2 [Hydractinia symbiolongicarpus]
MENNMFFFTKHCVEKFIVKTSLVRNFIMSSLYNAEEGKVMVSLVDVSDKKLFPHYLVVDGNGEKVKKDIHCINLKKGEPKKVKAAIEVQPIEGMVERAEHCIVLSQKFKLETHMSESTYANLNEVKFDDSEGGTKALKEITPESEWGSLLKKKKRTRGKKGRAEQKGPKLTQRCKLRVQLLIPNEHGGYTVYPPSFSNTIWNDNAKPKTVVKNTIPQAESPAPDKVAYVLLEPENEPYLNTRRAEREEPQPISQEETKPGESNVVLSYTLSNQLPVYNQDLIALPAEGNAPLDRLRNEPTLLKSLGCEFLEYKPFEPKDPPLDLFSLLEFPLRSGDEENLENLKNPSFFEEKPWNPVWLDKNRIESSALRKRDCEIEQDLQPRRQKIRKIDPSRMYSKVKTSK